MPDVSLQSTAQTALVAPSHNAGPHSGIPSISPRRSSHTRSEWSLSEGPQGTFEALSLMRAAVRGEAPPDYSGYQDAWIKKFVSDLLAGRAKPGTIEAIYVIFFFVRDQIEYFDHPNEEQVVQDARRTIELGHGDCVSQSVLLATLLAAAGIKSQFVVQMPSIEEGYSHVYVEALLNGQAISLDPIADAKQGRPLGSPGWSQLIPDGGMETSIPLF